MPSTPRANSRNAPTDWLYSPSVVFSRITCTSLVRRVVSRQTRLEIGLQLLSPQVSVAQVARRGQTPEKALFLHSLPAYGKFGGLITRPGLLQSGQAVSVDCGGQSLTRIVGAQLEANDGLCFFALHNPPPAG